MTHNWWHEPERPVEPPEAKVDGVLTCCECEETIPGDAPYFDIRGEYYCEECMEGHKHYAPYKGEWC